MGASLVVSSAGWIELIRVDVLDSMRTTPPAKSEDGDEEAYHLWSRLVGNSRWFDPPCSRKLENIFGEEMSSVPRMTEPKA